MRENGLRTPWGIAQDRKQIAEGVAIVSCAGHGGVLVGLAVADDNLSDLAWGVGERWSNYLAFEEDCAAAVVFYDRPEWWRAELRRRLEQMRQAVPGYLYTADEIERYTQKITEELEQSDADIRAYFAPTVDRWYAGDRQAEIRQEGAEKRRTYRTQSILFVGDRVWLRETYNVPGPFTIEKVKPLLGRDEHGVRYRIPRRGIARRERGNGAV